MMNGGGALRPERSRAWRTSPSVSHMTKRQGLWAGVVAHLSHHEASTIGWWWAAFTI